MTDKPRRAITLTLDIQADTRADMIAELRRIIERIVRAGQCVAETLSRSIFLPESNRLDPREAIDHDTDARQSIATDR